METRPSFCARPARRHRGQAGTSVAQRQARPAGEIAVIGRSVADEVAAGQLGERRVTVDRFAPGRASRGPGRRRGPCRSSAPAPAMPLTAAKKRRWISAWRTSGTSAAPSSRSLHLRTRVSGPSSASARSIRESARSPTPRARSPSPRAGDECRKVSSGGVVSSCSERVILAAHQVQRAAVEPGDQQRALLAQGAVDVRGASPSSAPVPPAAPRGGPGPARRAGARQPRRVAGRRARQGLGRQSLGEAQSTGGHVEPEARATSVEGGNAGEAARRRGEGGGGADDRRRLSRGRSARGGLGP